MSGRHLTVAEQRVWEAFPTGRTVTIGHSPHMPASDPDTVVRAEVIARLLLGECDPAPGHVPALRLRGAAVTGELDLSGCDVPYALAMTECTFQQEPRLEAASTKLINLSGSRLPGLLMRDARVDGFLRLTGCRSDQPVQLARAHVTGTADLSNASISGAPALHADSLIVERDLICRDATINGELLMWSARIGGTLVMEATHIINPDGVTLNGDGLVVDGGLFCGEVLTPSRAMLSQGELRLQDAKVSRCCVLTGARLSNPSGTALSAERLHVDGPLTLTDATVEGTVLLAGASVQGQLALQGTTLNAPGRNALDASLARIGADLAGTPGFSAHGQIVLDDAHIDGSVELAEARLHNPHGDTLSARRLHVLGRAYCDGLTSEGQIVLNDANVGASAEFHRARLRNPSGNTLTAWGLTVGGALDCCDGFVSHGGMSLTASQVTSAVCLARSTITGSLSLRKVRAGAVKTDTHTELSGPVDLRYAQVDVLTDAPARWPDDLLLDGLVYQQLEAALPVESRLAWLAKENSGYLPQPYEQLAAAYTNSGHDAAAREVLLAKCRCQRATRPPALRLWGYIQDWTVGYGYRPARAAGWLTLLLLTATVVFAAHQPPAAKPAEAPPFNAFLFVLDLLLPVVSFGQEQAFHPHGWQQWLAAGLIAAGWILATTIAAGLTRILSRR
ncbi:hypothetical protein SUDANB15_07559 (plasmid) [Streptomyces sp. enrichment culture]|uniref:hypothetical protein n=1 Tax=Streptomyces sp. enrichment culture TaxID=1795815 RepID=UPI003F56E692